MELVMQGELNNPRRIMNVLDTLWEGEEAWAAGCGLDLHRDLEELLAQD
jgi:hypothetical protein